MSTLTLRKLELNIQPTDIAAFAEIHKAAFPRSLTTRLGDRFLLDYYSRVLDSPIGIAFLAERDGEALGFAVGFVDPARFYCDMHERKWEVARSMIVGLLKKPWLIGSVVTNFLWARNSEHSGSDTCELASIAVLPKTSGSGLGRALLDEFVSAAADAGAIRITLTTDAEDNDRVHGFYEKYGLVKGGYSKGRTRPMVQYNMLISKEVEPGKSTR